MSDAGGNAVIYYHPDGYDTAGRRLMGRQSAGASFLAGFARHARTREFVCMARDRRIAEQFSARVQEAGAGREIPVDKIRWVALDAPERLGEVGCLFYPSPTVADLAWQRRRYDQRGWSLCGVTHTTASDTVMEAIGAFATAPLQSWDAVICTSESVRRTVERVLGEWQYYLASRLGASAGPKAALQLPVIPLGIDCDAFAPDKAAGAALRRERDIPTDAVVALFLGRLSATAKAHPLPVFAGLQQAATRTGKPVHLLLAGWFETAEERRQIERLAAHACPDVPVHLLDGRDPAVRRGAWSAADLFTSLSDNIQETFGLTPIEAMAAGLPVVISDWNGYRDTLAGEQHGIAIPTLAPPPGTGDVLAERYRAGLYSYGGYIGRTAQFAAIDHAAAADAYTALVENDDRRRAMGEAGRRHARANFDWARIVPEYEALWAELAARRAQDAEVAPPAAGRAADPLRDDPFRVFSDYPSMRIEDNMTVRRRGANDDLAALARFEINTLSNTLLPSNASVHALLARLDEAPGTPVGELAPHDDAEARRRTLRALAWLAKMGIVEIG